MIQQWMIVLGVHLLSKEVKIVPAAITQLSLRQSSPGKSLSHGLGAAPVFVVVVVVDVVVVVVDVVVLFVVVVLVVVAMVDASVG